MNTYRYSTSALNGDLARAGIGFVLCTLPIAVVTLELWVTLLLAAPAGLFAIFGIRTWLRRRARVTIDESGITLSGLVPTRIAWSDLDRFKLSYFSTRRDRSNGWMQLNLKDSSGRLAVDSSLDGFDDVCRRAFRAATDNGAELSSATLRNLAALGLVTDLNPDPQPNSGTGWGNPADWRR